MPTAITLEGHDALIAKLKTMGNAPRVMDAAFQKVARASLRRLKISTPKKTGNTARAWVSNRLFDSQYSVSNDVKSVNKKHLIAVILDEGRGIVRPKSSSRLYIPLSEKGRAKKLGAKIPRDFIYGVDYVLAKSAKATSGVGNIKKELVDSKRELVDAVSAEINKIHG